MGFETTTMRVVGRVRERGPLARYGSAVVTVATASAITAVTLPLLNRSLLVFYFAAVVASAWVGGVGPGLLATLIAVLAANYLFIPPPGLALLDAADFFPLAMFTLVSVMVSSLSGALTSARRRAEAQAATLRDQAERLEEQAAALERQVAESRAASEALEHANEDLNATIIVADATREAAERAERRVSAILSSISDAFVAFDRDWRFVYINDTARTLFRQSDRADMIGRVVWDALPHLAGSVAEREMRRAVEERVPVEFETFEPDQGVWHEVRVYPSVDGVSAVWRDVTARRRAEEALHYLAEVNSALAASLDYEATLGAVAQLVVPHLADWCSVSIVEPDGTVRQLAVAHAEPFKAELARELDRDYPVDPAAATGVARVLRTGRSELYAELPDELLARSARDDLQLRILRELGLKSAMVVPLTARGRTLGALTLVAAESGRRYGPADLALAEELGRRAGLAVDNARLYREAERANRVKAEFLAVMSHELRTPLNAIGGYAQLLEMGVRGPVTPSQTDDLRRIQKSQKHLLGLINDVLNFAKLEAGQVKFDIRPVSLEVVVRDLDVLIEPQMLARGLRYTRLVAKADDDVPLAVLADPEKLEQVVLNLLANAVKFTPSGGEVTLACEPDGAGHVAVRVRDTGRGIPPDKLEAIFEPFVQVERAMTRSVDGTGLGLAISRDLARAMGGDLIAESTLGAGSTFTLVLPRA